MVKQFIDTRSLLDLCEETNRKQRARVGMRQWYQTGIDLAGARETKATTAETDEDEREIDGGKRVRIMEWYNSRE